MPHITITTPENIEIKYRLAGTGSRLAAVCIDLIIQAFVIILIGIISIVAIVSFTNMEVIELENIVSGSGSSTPFGVLAIFVIAVFAVCFFYYITFEMISNGQTPGKKLLGLRVIKRNGQSISFTQSLVRNILRYSVDLVVGIVSIFVSKTCSRVGDMVASTYVVAENSKEINRKILHDNNYNLRKPSTADQYRLRSDEIELLREFLSRRNDFNDLGFSLFKKIASHYAIKFNISPEIITVATLEELLMNQ